MKAAEILSLPILPRDTWLATRRNGIGGSEVAAVLGISPWGGPWSVWADKRGILQPRAESVAMRAGTVLEALALDLFGETFGVEVQRVGSRIAWFGGREFATLDGIATIDGAACPVEAKTARSRDGWGAVGSDEVPDHYRAQVLWQLAALPDAPAAFFSVIFGGSDHAWYRVPRDDESLEAMRDLAASWWMRHMGEHGTEPPPDGSDAATAEILRRHPLPKLDAAECPDAAEAIRAYGAAAEARGAAEAAMKAPANVLRALIGDREGVFVPGVGKASWAGKDGKRTLRVTCFPRM